MGILYGCAQNINAFLQQKNKDEYVDASYVNSVILINWINCWLSHAVVATLEQFVIDKIFDEMII